jgi:fumarate reductase subunit D
MAKRSNEPIFWSIFGAGGVVSALALPGLVLVTGLLVPLGWLPEAALSYERVSGFAGSLLGSAIVLAVIFLSLWHAGHRIFHSLHDFGVHANMGRLKKICYGAAAAGGAWAALMLVVLRF